MRKLELVGLDADGRQVVFVDETGAEYAAPADDRLRAALRGDRAKLGQLEIEMDSALRPRDIQARIRAGESPESVAVMAQVSVDKIMAYCVPVLAERRHMAELARRHHVRRKNAEGPARSLDAVVSERLRSRGIDPATADWDAWRRDDGRWAVRTAYRSGEQEHTAAFVFDAIGRYSLADDDEAKWLTGEQQSTRKGPQPREPGKEGERRLSSVRTGDDLLSLSDGRDDDSGDDELTDDLTAVVRAVREPDLEPAAERDPQAVADDPEAPGESRDRSDDDGFRTDERRIGGDESRESTADVGAESDTEKTGEVLSEPERDRPSSPASEPGTTPPPEAAAPAEPAVEATPGRRRRTARRSSVPTWDEIMFGKSKDEER